MNRIAKMTLAALTSCAALVAAPASADTIANPTNSYSFPSLSGSLTGGQQTQYIGQTFTAPIAGELTNFQFTLNTSSLQSIYGIVYAWNGTSPTGAALWQSENVAGTQGLLDFNPVGVGLTAGQTYVAFLSTYGIDGNSGLASVGTCLVFGGCTSNSVPNLGTLVTGTVYDDGVSYSQANNAFDATFSATITAAAPVPEPASWALMIGGIGVAGAALRRRRNIATTVRFA